MNFSTELYNFSHVSLSEKSERDLPMIERENGWWVAYRSISDRSWSLCVARQMPRCLPTAAATCRRQTRPGCIHLPSMTAPDHGGTWRWSSLAWRWFAGGPEASKVDAALEW